MTHLFIIAHPDDEILGSCGTILQLKKRGEAVVVATMSHKSRTRENGLKDVQKATHDVLGVDASYWFEYDMMRFGEYDRYEMTRNIESVIQKTGAEVIYTHDQNDIHNDHRVLNGVVLEAVKLPMRGGYSGPKIRSVYTMEVPTSTDWGAGFIPNSFVEIDQSAIKIKTELLDKYDDVIRPVPHPRNYESLLSLARYRGCQCGCLYAEAYRKVFELAEMRAGNV